MAVITAVQLEEMKQADIRTVDRSKLVDIQDIVVNRELKKESRILDYIKQVQNPYCFKYGDYTVKIGFSNTEVTLTERVKEFIDRTNAPNI